MLCFCWWSTNYDKLDLHRFTTFLKLSYFGSKIDFQVTVPCHGSNSEFLVHQFHQFHCHHHSLLIWWDCVNPHPARMGWANGVYHQKNGRDIDDKAFESIKYTIWRDTSQKGTPGSHREKPHMISLDLMVTSWFPVLSANQTWLAETITIYFDSFLV